MTKNGHSSAPSNKGGHGVYKEKTGDGGSKNDTSICGGKGGTSGSGNDTPQYLKEFVENTLKGGTKNWPTSTKNDNAPSDTRNDNAKAVAGDLTKLTTEEKTIVAGLLAKTIEGGEVVEIRAVSSTSVMVNACYDLLKGNQSHYLSGCCNLIFQLL
ncbi:surface antigen family protein [Anaplasma phagocytophilum str. ApMUC09]|uniref:Surface antigen family protein n=1 Tax=Anaplasma phagocytophilum str. ApMUC09 TaxID=1359152 RepID=A0A0F3N8I9_ANAPH|nr:surface antigen family protein [Anaplasma phagocytophilum str. ApMUC09]SCV63649.1 Surface antigen [Anaplasma phagocytophilum]